MYSCHSFGISEMKSTSVHMTDNLIERTYDIFPNHKESMFSTNLVRPTPLLQHSRVYERTAIRKMRTEWSFSLQVLFKKYST